MAKVNHQNEKFVIFNSGSDVFFEKVHSCLVNWWNTRKYLKVSHYWTVFAGITRVNFIQFWRKYSYENENFVFFNFISDVFFEKVRSCVVNWWNTMTYLKVSQDWIILTGVTRVNFIQFWQKYTHQNENFVIFNFVCHLFFEKVHSCVVNWRNTMKYLKVSNLAGVSCPWQCCQMIMVEIRFFKN